MKIIFENIKKNYFIKIAFIIFIVQCIFSFYNSISLDSIDILFSGIINNFSTFLMLYALGFLVDKGGKNEK